MSIPLNAHVKVIPWPTPSCLPNFKPVLRYPTPLEFVQHPWWLRTITSWELQKNAIQLKNKNDQKCCMVVWCRWCFHFLLPSGKLWDWNSWNCTGTAETRSWVGARRWSDEASGRDPKLWLVSIIFLTNWKGWTKILKYIKILNNCELLLNHAISKHVFFQNYASKSLPSKKKNSTLGKCGFVPTQRYDSVSKWRQVLHIHPRHGRKSSLCTTRKAKTWLGDGQTSNIFCSVTIYFWFFVIFCLRFMVEFQLCLKPIDSFDCPRV